MSTRSFHSAAEAAAYLKVRQRRQRAAAQAGLRAAVKLVETDAKAKPGTDQAGWPALAESTLADKSRKGLPSPSPLLRTGDLRESIVSHVDGDEGIVGSDSKVLIYQELGTTHIPPRSILESTALEDEEKVIETITKALIGGLL